MTDFLIILVLGLHLLAANVAAAGPIVSAWLDWRSGRGDQLAGHAAGYLSQSALLALLVATVLGAILFGLAWTDPFRTAIERLGYKLVSAVGEWLFSFILMAVHLFWYKRKPDVGRLARIARMVVAILAATNLLYHFPVLFTVLAKTSAGYLPGDEAIRGGLFREQLLSGDVVSKTLHVWLASFAVTGVMLMGYALRLERRGGSSEDVQRLARWGGMWSLVPTILQIPVGIWVVTQLPRPAMRTLMGRDPVTSVLFVLSIGLAFALLHLLAAAAMRGANRQTMLRSMILMAVIVIIMSGVLHRTNRVRASAEPKPEANARFQVQYGENSWQRKS